LSPVGDNLEVRKIGCAEERINGKDGIEKERDQALP